MAYNKEKLPVLKIPENLSEFVEFKFNEFKSGEGQYGRWYLTTIVNRGVDKNFFPSEVLVGLLNAYQPLQGKTLEITKVKDGDYASWDIKENGVSKTTQAPPSHPTPQSNTNVPPSDIEAVIEKMRNAFRGMDIALKSAEKKIVDMEESGKDLRAKVDTLQMEISSLRGADSNKKMLKEDYNMAKALGIGDDDINIPII